MADFFHVVFSRHIFVKSRINCVYCTKSPTLYNILSVQIINLELSNLLLYVWMSVCTECHMEIKWNWKFFFLIVDKWQNVYKMKSFWKCGLPCLYLQNLPRYLTLERFCCLKNKNLDRFLLSLSILKCKCSKPHFGIPKTRSLNY